MLFAIMGAGCEWLSNVASPQADVVTGAWKDGRIATVRGQRPSTGYGFLTFANSKVQTHGVGTQYIYRELLKQILQMLETGKPPVDPKETIEIVRFIELAAESSANHGGPRHF
jgi:hypothetical protein